jgi:hypothetical protein
MYWGAEVQLHSLTLALEGGERSASRPDSFKPGVRATRYPLVKGWVGHRAGLDAVAKKKIPSPCRDLNTPIIQPVGKV